MDADEYMETFKKHVKIAKRLFINIPNEAEWTEWAEHATHVAILTHKEEQGSLSTHVHYLAKRYRNKFVRDYRKWSGIHLSSKNLIKGQCVSVRKYVRTYRQQYTHTSLLYEVYGDTDNTEIALDIKSLIEDLEQKHNVFSGKLSVLVEGWMSGKSAKIIAKELGCSRQWVQHLKKEFKNALKHYQQEN